MINLLRSDFYKLFRKKSFYICGIVLAALVLMTIFTTNWLIGMGYILDQNSGIDAAYMSLGNVSLMSAIFISILIPSEFSFGTIKNIASRGISRTNIYLSKLIIGISVVVIYSLFVSIVGFTTGSILWGTGEFTNEIAMDLFKSIGLFLLALIAFTSINVMVGFLVRGTGGTVAINLGLMMFIEPVISLINVIAHNVFKASEDFNFNKYYLERYMAVNPAGVLDDVLKTGIIVAIVYFVISTIIGIYTFNKRDIK